MKRIVTWSIFALVSIVLAGLVPQAAHAQAGPIVDPELARLVIAIEGFTALAGLIALVVLGLKMNKKEPATVILLLLLGVGVLFVGGLAVGDYTKLQKARSEGRIIS
ncbi:MAG: hypothetical protein D6795_05255 [Deltaproteobacteria bacterium]|nr:MAG: hypothetical protein D6795_05255 [Deltaproteobacteria bacterium]